MSVNSFKSLSNLKVGKDSTDYFRLKTLIESKVGQVEKLPFSLKILLENLLRQEDGVSVTADDVRAVAEWPALSAVEGDAKKISDREISFMPARVILPEFTGVPCGLDLASLRNAVANSGR